MNSGGTVKLNAPWLFAVVVAIVVNGTEYGNSDFWSATGVELTPLTVPVIVSPVPHTGRIVDGVIATPVGIRGVVNERLEPRVTPAALVATARYW